MSSLIYRLLITSLGRAPGRIICVATSCVFLTYEWCCCIFQPPSPGFRDELWSLLMCSPLSRLSVIYLTQRKWQVLMWYKDKCSGLMELKSTLLFPCCARWHMWDSCLSLKKINARGIFPAKESSLGARMPSSAWEVISLDFSFLISPSLHKL